MTRDAGRRGDGAGEGGYPTRFGSPEQSPGFLLWRVANAWQARQRAALAPLDLTHVQFVVLAVAGWLGRGGDPPSQVALARHARIDPMMTSQVVRTLERKGLLRRAAHPRDARANALLVTDDGAALLARAVPVVEAVDDAFFADLGSAGAAFAGMLATLARPAVDAVEPVEAEGREGRADDRGA